MNDISTNCSRNQRFNIAILTVFLMHDDSDNWSATITDFMSFSLNLGVSLTTFQFYHVNSVWCANTKYKMNSNESDRITFTKQIHTNYTLLLRTRISNLLKYTLRIHKNIFFGIVTVVYIHQRFYHR